MTAREWILGRIHEIQGASSIGNATEAWRTLPRNYRAASSITGDETLDLLIDRLQDYDAMVYRVQQEEVVTAIQAILAGTALQPVLVPAGFPPHLLPSNAECVIDAGFAPHELNRFPVVLTTATLAIAETGTIVLQNVPGQGRRAASLVPDVHICVIDEGSVVHTVPQAVRLLQHTAALPTTFISGPSATADIEMTRIKGVHGPRFLHIILVPEAPSLPVPKDRLPKAVLQ